MAEGGVTVEVGAEATNTGRLKKQPDAHRKV